MAADENRQRQLELLAERLKTTVFGDDSRNPPTEGLVQRVTAQEGIMYGVRRDGQQVAPSLLERQGAVESELQKLSKAVAELKDRRRFWLEMTAAGITILGVVLNLVLQIRAAGIVR